METTDHKEAVDYLISQFEDGLTEMTQDAVTAPDDDLDEVYEQAQEAQVEIYSAFVKRLFDLYGPVEYSPEN